MEGNGTTQSESDVRLLAGLITSHDFDRKTVGLILRSACRRSTFIGTTDGLSLLNREILQEELVVHLSIGCRGRRSEAPHFTIRGCVLEGKLAVLESARRSL